MIPAGLDSFDLGSAPFVLFHPVLYILVNFLEPASKSILRFSDNQPMVTEAIKKVLKDDYNYDSTVSC
jgi:hypothetical protein